MNDTYDEFTDLLGAYALDAVDPDERERVERHLLDCPRCRAEVAEHREVASFLAHSGADAPDGVWDRIAAELSPPAPPLRLQVTPPEPPPAPAPVAPADDDDVVVPLDRSRRRFAGRTMLAVVAAAACIVAVLGIISVDQSRRLDRLEGAVAERSIEGLANDAVAESEVTAQLSGTAGEAQAVVNHTGQGYLIMSGVPAPAEGDVYQLWGKVDEAVLSLGTFGGDTPVVPFSVDPARIDDIELFAVTQERAPGVPISEQDPILAGTV
ncbi:MAG: anti-sigma factor [Acidimicrobiales bacterium]|nr:anti-sigma factor [Acidimicrobiales bacterium]